MDVDPHSFGAVYLSPTPATYLQDIPIFSPNPLEQLAREDFLLDTDGIIQPYHSFSPVPFGIEQLDVEDMLRDDDDDDNSNGAQPDTHPAEHAGPTTATATV